MDRDKDRKRVFFAFEVISPWLENLPDGRKLESSDRHLTVVFLGDIHYAKLENILPNIPLPKIKVGLTGKFDRCVFLPQKRPNVVAWHVKWFDDEHDLGSYQKEMANWLIKNGFPVHIHPNGFLPHVTLSRRPFRYHEWREAFQILPVVIKNFHLYESIGGLKYKPLWSHHLLPPFEVIKNNGEFKMDIRGESFTQLFHHCLIGIAFENPQILRLYREKITVNDSDGLISNLDTMLKMAEKKGLFPYQKVLSIQEPQQNSEGVLFWSTEFI